MHVVRLRHRHEVNDVTERGELFVILWKLQNFCSKLVNGRFDWSMSLSCVVFFFYLDLDEFLIGEWKNSCSFHATGDPSELNSTPLCYAATYLQPMSKHMSHVWCDWAAETFAPIKLECKTFLSHFVCDSLLLGEMEVSSFSLGSHSGSSANFLQESSLATAVTHVRLVRLPYLSENDKDKGFIHVNIHINNIHI